MIAAGGTAGHVVPAIAVADALRAEGAQVSFVGGQRAEAELVPAAGYPLDPIRVEGISRTNPLKAPRAVAKAGLALRSAGAHPARPRSRRRARRRRVRRGACRARGACCGASRSCLPRPTRTSGLSNRLLAPRARRVCLAFPIPGREGERYLVTGRPVPPRDDRARGRPCRARDRPDERCVLVFGGSLGARSINEAAVAAFADAPYRVLHVAGRRDFADLRAPGPHYDLRDYLDPFGPALAAADLAVARAGGSIFELAQYGLPAVLVPYPHATADHQTANARWMQDGGAAVVIADAELTAERLRAEVDAILLDPVRLRRDGGGLGSARPARRRARRRRRRARRRG